MPIPFSKISVQEYYENFAEGNRLLSGLGQLEFERTKIILQRFLPPPPGRVLDIGGGAGIYSLWLATLDYQVHLIEPSHKLVAEARKASQQQSAAPLASVKIGDARNLDVPDHCADAILLLGPLYHLTEKADRHQALQEAFRVLKSNGILFAAAISRFASAIDGFLQGFITDPIFAEMVKQDLFDGQHRNSTDNIRYFTDAFFHLPMELTCEIEEVGFKVEQLFPIEGVGTLAKNFDELWKDEAHRSYLLEIIKLTEREASILGVSPHLLCVARKER